VSEPVIEVSELRLSAGDQVLLEDASLEVKRGELCLLVGASGTGKSLTLQLLSGLQRPSKAIAIEGRIEVLGHDVLDRREDAGVPGTGIVFQDFALMDDLSARGNVLFGVDHKRHPPQDRRAAADALLEEFRLPGGRQPAAMSGGMKQRLALARSMAFGPDLLFYDEPTSGLDPAMSLQVARRIREVHDRHQTTSMVVTHDLPALVDIADRILLLDPARRCFREVTRDTVDQALRDLRDFRPPEEEPEDRGSALARAAIGFFGRAGSFVLGAGSTLASLVPRYPRARWGLRFFWRFLRLTTLGSALPFLALAGFISGLITTYFTFSLLPLQGFTEPVLIEEFIGSLGYALYRVVIPGVTTLLFASRSGAAIAADIGNRVLTRQVDALRSHGIPPARYLLTGLSLASLVGIPLLFMVSDFFSRMASVGVFLATHPGHGAYAFSQQFPHLLGDDWYCFPGGTQFVLGKLLICALGTAGIAYHTGIRPKNSGAEVAEAVTASIIRSTLFVLSVHLVFAFFEFD
jgi:ABC-type transporter Mla maintaining outer membrane lipid asymmetry ATPase subunit MlaF/ABC-type transporter Mla maintaining outer membrane lipid asymmetry permease subunit MlaE